MYIEANRKQNLQNHIMSSQIRRVDSKEKFNELVDDYQFQGYDIKEATERHAELKKSSFGSVGMHVLWFLLTFWFTMGIGNAIYAWYAYANNSKTILVKFKKEQL